MRSVVPFLSSASHTGCTKVILQICTNWLERVHVEVSKRDRERDRELQRERDVEIGDKS